ncbi:DNA-binding SARP family transcriptional activator [Lentzea nigeriaca]|uniref:BTAD domain-containing putative transcriptional regulator n=1 Tax=Lentzea nigeriaca TaxID=1128665 RepID=UPI0027DD25B8|nr:BTAD domain-containing putative transcriptional regulator [Lentzea nigeriaca]MBM7862634.1 DNA-binding SARP family transcriptional activator [Lentzea nigeriaca]
MQIRVLGPVTVIGTDGRVVAVGSKRRRELLGRLVAAGGRVVSLEALIDDLWEDPPAGAVGAVRTFVSELRAALGSDVIETVGRGYVLRAADVDVWRFEKSPSSVSWGEPYADLDPSPWVLQERARLLELRARALLDQGRGASLVCELSSFAAAHPWREKAQVLLAHALYQDGRQVEALDVLREARGRLVDRFGLDAVPDLDRAEDDILRHAVARGGSYARLRSASVVAGEAALTGGLALAQAQRFAAVAEAERLGDPLLTARVLTAYDVPSNWTVPDDAARAGALVEAARRTLRLLPADAPVALRARLLAVIALEHRGTRDLWAAEAACEAERLARELGDPAVLVVALNARFMQSFQQPGRSAERARIAAELIEVSARHDLPAYETLGHLVGMQAWSALGDFTAAARHAAAVEQLAEIHETPLVHVFTAGFRLMRAPDEAGYRALDLSCMPGVEAGFLPLALLSLGLPPDLTLDWGPYRPWAEALVMADRDVPTPRADHYYEVLWWITARIAEQRGDEVLAAAAREALEPASGEIIGGTTAMISFGRL